MKRKAVFIKKRNYFFQIVTMDNCPMTLYIDMKNQYFSGHGSICLDLPTLEKAKNDFRDFFENKIDYIYLKDTDSVDYYLSIRRNVYYIEISGKIGDFVEQSLEFSMGFFEGNLCDYTIILDTINGIKDGTNGYNCK